MTNGNMEKFNWRAALIKLRGTKRIAVHFERTEALVGRFRKILGAKWCNRLNVWHLPAAAGKTAGECIEQRRNKTNT